VYRPVTDYPPLTVNVHLALAGMYSLKVYNSAGELVKTLKNERAANAPIDEALVWEGKNEAGDPVASGVYILQFVSRYESRSARVLILR
jgi:flagellar hook assembly protein FlgD